jgi:hypothetical protein
MRCWRNSVTFAVSHDGGYSFSQPPSPANLIASLPWPYKGDLGRHVGYFNPTNIVLRDGWYYAMMSTTEDGAQKAGACLMRSNRLDDPRAWRAWDGHDFTVRFLDPYREPAGNPGEHVCAPVGTGRLLLPLGNIERHQPSGRYIVLMAGTRRSAPGAQPVSGVYAATSRDLVNWSEPSLVWASPVRPDGTACPVALNDYPSLLDPTSDSRNFETVGDRAYVYFTRYNLHDCRSGQDRDLMRRAVRIELTGP